jgi:sortase A
MLLLLLPVAAHLRSQQVQQGRLAAAGEARREEPAEAGPRAMLLAIPRIGLRQALVNGIDREALAGGPGHYAGTPAPGRAGNSVIAGHRTLRGVPSFFYRLNELEPGDAIEVVSPFFLYRYEVERVFLVSPEQTWVLGHTAYPALTLITCDPPGTEQRRLIVRARLTGVREAPGNPPR